MKYTIVLAGMLALLSSCGGDKKTDEKTGSADSSFVSVNAPEAEAGSTGENLSNKAVLLWNASVISAPSSKDGKWVASYQFGNTLTLTGKKEENTTEKRTYLEVTGPDGKTGWINEYMVATNAKVAVATGDISLYKNPDVMSVSTDKVAIGDIVALSGDNKDGFRQVYGKEKKIKGFVNLFDNLSSEPIDLKVASLYQQAISKKTPEEQLTALQAIVSDQSNASSKLYARIQTKVSELSGHEIGEEEYDVPRADTAIDY